MIAAPDLYSAIERGAFTDPSAKLQRMGWEVRRDVVLPAQGWEVDFVLARPDGPDGTERIVVVEAVVDPGTERMDEVWEMQLDFERVGDPTVTFAPLFYWNGKADAVDRLRYPNALWGGWVEIAALLSERLGRGNWPDRRIRVDRESYRALWPETIWDPNLLTLLSSFAERAARHTEALVDASAQDVARQLARAFDWETVVDFGGGAVESDLATAARAWVEEARYSFSDASVCFDFARRHARVAMAAGQLRIDPEMVSLRDVGDGWASRYLSERETRRQRQLYPSPYELIDLPPLTVGGLPDPVAVQEVHVLIRRGLRIQDAKLDTLADR